MTTVFTLPKKKKMNPPKKKQQQPTTRKLSYQGWYSGGVIVMVRKKYSEYVERIPTDFEQNYIIVVLKMDKELLQTSKAIMLVCSYIYLCMILVTGKTPSTDFI